MVLINFFQQFDHPTIIFLMKFFTLLGDESFYLLVVPIVYWCWRKKVALPLLFILLLNFYLSWALKEWFHLPRPEGLTMIDADGYGFPSGHAMGAMVLWGYLAWVINSYLLSGIIIFFIGLSRVYLGVHFPYDVVGGWTIGFCYLYIAILAEKQIVRRRVKFPPRVTTSLVVFTGIMLALLTPSDISIRVGGMLAGMGGGMIMERIWVKFQPRTDWWKQIIKVVIGVAGILALRIGLKLLLPENDWTNWIRYFAMGVWAGLAVTWLFGKLGLNAPLK